MTSSETPLISVVVGVLNGGRTLERFIDSFAQQTLARRELIIKDGGSTDDTLDIVKRHQADIAYWTSCPDKGLYDAWNSVLDKCRGDWICFLGCDDLFADPTTLQGLADRIPATDPPDLICSRNALVDDDGKFIKVIGRPWSWTDLKRAQVLAHAGLLHHASLFKKHGGFNTEFRIGGDYEFLLRLGPNARCQFVDQITVRIGGSGMSHRRWTRTFGEHWLAQSRHPDIGMATATKNYSANVARYMLRKLRGRR
jgi:glycosyltransferase involved in cell wall biosynthesis